VLGAGTVGASVLRLLERHGGVDVTAALVRDVARPRDLGRWSVRTTDDPEVVLDGADVVVELIGGVARATELARDAIQRGARLVTANKAAVTEAWSAWRPWIEAGRVGMEAAVMAGTPVIGPLSGALRGSAPLALHAVLNGTCAFVIERLESGSDFSAAVAEAQRLGYAEADPSLDIDGIDAAHKLTLVTRLAFDPGISWEWVRAATRGIRGLGPGCVRREMAAGRRVRLVASVWPGSDGWRAAVRPVALPADHPLVTAGSGRNALVFSGDAVGEVLIAGPGAGAEATASAVVADVLEAIAGRPGPVPRAQAAPLPGAPRGDDDPLGSWSCA
jgi:homoserine dehydrogenase